LEAGDKVPADARLFKARNLSVNESMLTGESLPVFKRVETVPDEALIADRVNMVYMNTLIFDGEGYGIVTATGHQTEIGHIASLIVHEKESLTPLHEKLKQLGNFIIFVCIVISIVVGFTMLLLGNEAKLAFLTGVSLAVAAIPEGLPAIITIALAIGVQRMARNNAIIKHLPAVETLGCATIICSDKTGTITQNEMTCVSVAFNGEAMKPEDIGEEDNRLVDLIARTGVLCNNSNLTHTGPVGDPTETALLSFAQNRGIDFIKIRKGAQRLGSIPFSSVRMEMSTIDSLVSGEIIIHTKGALERVLENCKYYAGRDLNKIILDENAKTRILESNSFLTKDGLRVLGFAYRVLEKDEFNQTEDYTEFEKNLIFIGMLGLLDPPREDVGAAIRRCESAGITPIMITGDHLLTAQNIARQVGILDPGELSYSGLELEKLSQERYLRLVDKISVYARISPSQKLRIVDTLRTRGNVVAMTGDGINDVPAIKNSDIGIAMGKTGTEVTINSADMVLLDDNFSTIVKAVEEGRVIYDNIKKFIQYLISCNIGEVLTIFISII
ncbi:MAG TPA: HAD family hydrolase, partial [Firmicutes bacterium]|nr:HAD family hydrolase [Bacillota bacterium]